jgi:hypothetical protein
VISAAHALNIALATRVARMGVMVDSRPQTVPEFLEALEQSIEGQSREEKTSLTFRFPACWPYEQRAEVNTTLRAARYDVRYMGGCRYAVSWARLQQPSTQEKAS